MDWAGFKTTLFANGIRPLAIDACKEFVENEMLWHQTSAHSSTKTDDLGFAECRDITTLEQGIKELQTIQFYSTIDDTPARTRRAELKFDTDPSKHFKRILLKTYWITQ